MQHIVTDDHDLGDGLILYTEYKPVDEEAGVWGWYWAIEQEDEELEELEEPMEEWQFLSEALRPLGDMNIALLRGFFGPFGTEVVAKNVGISLCVQIISNSEPWKRLTSSGYGSAWACLN